MLDVTALILEEHHTLRQRFAALDDARGTEALTVLWQELAVLLDAHAACEEEVFYPRLLKVGEDAEDEAEDAIEDHDKIRDAVRDAERHEVGSDAWWEAVGVARDENSKHIAEEEREALPDFRRTATEDARAELAVAWTRWRSEHFPPQGVDTDDKDAGEYIAAHT